MVTGAVDFVRPTGTDSITCVLVLELGLSLQTPRRVLQSRDGLHLLCFRQHLAQSGTSANSWGLSSRTSRFKMSSKRQAVYIHVVARTLDGK